LSAARCSGYLPPARAAELSKIFGVPAFYVGVVRAFRRYRFSISRTKIRERYARLSLSRDEYRPRIRRRRRQFRRVSVGARLAVVSSTRRLRTNRVHSRRGRITRTPNLSRREPPGLFVPRTRRENVYIKGSRTTSCVRTSFFTSFRFESSLWRSINASDAFRDRVKSRKYSLPRHVDPFKRPGNEQQRTVNPSSLLPAQSVYVYVCVCVFVCGGEGVIYHPADETRVVLLLYFRVFPSGDAGVNY